MSAGARWSPENIARIRTRAAAAAATAIPEAPDESLQEAAAVLSRFDHAPSVRPGVDGRRDVDGLRRLLTDSVLREGAEGGRYVLRSDVRKRVLGRLFTRERMLAALERTWPRPDDAVQRVLEEHLRKEPRPLDALSGEELVATLQVIDWLGGTDLVLSLPDLAEVRRRVDLDALYRPFAQLAGEHFRGRKRELEALRDYVNGGGEMRQPLFIHGPGGMGKSSLVARFILDARAAGPESLPIVYLDCDRPGLMAEEPVTLLAEAVCQLGLQFPAFNATAARLRTAWLRNAAQGREPGAGQGSEQLETAPVTAGSHPEIEFSAFIHDIGAVDRSVLFVIDTFEELQYRSRDYVHELMSLLAAVRRSLPRLRTVFAGRHPVVGVACEQLPLGSLDQEAAIGYLGSRGITDPETARSLAAILGGNPLSLRLGAELVLREGPGARGLDEELRGRLDDTVVQGVLYRRILGHVHDPRVRALAHPGLVLRRITPAIIREVLAGPCGVAIASDAEAARLYDALRLELSLVVPEGDAVRHRPDVRRVMLGPLRRDKSARVRAIEEAAVAYYTRLDDPVSRAEEIITGWRSDSRHRRSSRAGRAAWRTRCGARSTSSTGRRGPILPRASGSSSKTAPGRPPMTSRGRPMPSVVPRTSRSWPSTKTCSPCSGGGPRASRAASFTSTRRERSNGWAG